MKRSSVAKYGLIVALSTILAACGKIDPAALSAPGAASSESVSASSTTGLKQLDVATSVTNAVNATKAAETAIYDAQSALSEITDAQGNIGVNIFKSLFTQAPTVSRGGLLAPVTNRIQSAFDVFFKKASALKASIGAARLALTVANAQLDLSDPAQQVLAQQIIAQMSALDAMESSLKAGTSALAGKVDQAQSGLTKLVSLGTSFIPVPGLNYVADILINTFLLGDLTSLLNSMKLKLLAF